MRRSSGGDDGRSADSWPRRRLLRAGLGVTVGGIAGCSGLSTDSSTDTSAGGVTADDGAGFDATETTVEIDSLSDAFRESPSSTHAPDDGVATFDWLDDRDLRVVKVTTLDSHGEGSLRWALDQYEPRIVVFEVGGVIDLAREQLEITGAQGDVLIAGQTAPPPGITLVRDSLLIQASNVVVQHLRVRPGTDIVTSSEHRGGEGHAIDAVSIGGDVNNRGNVIVDHCSISWGSDETLSVFSPSTSEGGVPSGETPPITLSNNIVAEGLANTDLHPESDHGFGSLLYGDYAYSVMGNLYANNLSRNPWIGNYYGPCEGALVNNLLHNCGTRDGGTIAVEPNGRTELAIVGNAYSNTLPEIDLTYGPGDRFDFSTPKRVYLHDNQVETVEGRYRYEVLDEPPAPLGSLDPIPAADVRAHQLRSVGARPANRTVHDRRVITQVREESGGILETDGIIDSQADVGGYPDLDTTRRALDVPSTPGMLGRWLYQHTRATELPDAEPPR